MSGPAGADPTGSKGRTIMTNEAGFVGGIDSHKNTIHVAVITELGVEVDDREFCTTQDRYRAAVALTRTCGGESSRPIRRCSRGRCTLAVVGDGYLP